MLQASEFIHALQELRRSRGLHALSPEEAAGLQREIERDNESRQRSKASPEASSELGSCSASGVPAVAVVNETSARELSLRRAMAIVDRERAMLADFEQRYRRAPYSHTLPAPPRCQ